MLLNLKRKLLTKQEEKKNYIKIEIEIVEILMLQKEMTLEVSPRP